MYVCVNYSKNLISENVFNVLGGHLCKLVCEFESVSEQSQKMNDVLYVCKYARGLFILQFTD